MTGNITRRGKSSWRLKFEGGNRDPATAKRRTRYVTVNGTKKDAQRELIRLLAEVESGAAIDPSKITLGEYIHGWLDTAHDLSPKTLERYRQLGRSFRTLARRCCRSYGRGKFTYSMRPCSSRAA